MSNIYAVVGGAHNSTPAPFDQQLTGSTLDPELASLIACIPPDDDDPYDDPGLMMCDCCDEMRRNVETAGKWLVCPQCRAALQAHVATIERSHPEWFGGAE